MAEVTFEKIGEEFRLSFGEDEQKASLTLGLTEARQLFFLLGAVIAGTGRGVDPPPLERQPFLDVFSPTYQIGSDDKGHPVLAVQIDPLPPFKFRFEERQAREIAQTFLEIVDTPFDIRTSKLLS